jgi:hypothetical protein
MGWKRNVGRKKERNFKRENDKEEIILPITFPSGLENRN